MGFMSFYCGFIYNDFFAIPTQIFTSCYEMGDKQIWNAELDGNATAVTGDYTYLRDDF